MDPMGYVYMFELIDFNISKESFWRSLFGSGGIWQSAWVHLLHDLDNLRHTEIYSLKNTCRVIIDHLFDCWMVLFPCLRFPVFCYFFICKTAKPPAATMRMSSCWHHRSSSLLASSLQCWRCRDLGRSPYCWWTNYFTSWYGRYPSIYRVSYMLAGCLGSLPSTVLGNFWRFCFFKNPFPKMCVGFSILTWPNSSLNSSQDAGYRFTYNFDYIEFIFSNEAITTWIPQPNQCSCETSLRPQWLTWNLKIPPKKEKEKTIYYKTTVCTTRL